MKWIAAMLMIVNVAVYLWAGGRQSEGAPAAAVLSDVNREGMRLLREVAPVRRAAAVSAAPVSSRSRSDGSVTTALEDTDIVGEELAPGGEAAAAVAASAAPDADERLCHRVGPFKREDAWQAALAWMADNGLFFQRVTNQHREHRAVRVFLGPFASPAEIGPVRSLLRDKELENFTYHGEDGAMRISLGYFTQEELAAKFMEHLKSLGVVARSRPEYRPLGPYSWMEIPPGQADMAALTGRNWGENGVRVTAVAC